MNTIGFKSDIRFVDRNKFDEQFEKCQEIIVNGVSNIAARAGTVGMNPCTGGGVTDGEKGVVFHSNSAYSSRIVYEPAYKATS